jgi:hypothetical protein
MEEKMERGTVRDTTLGGGDIFLSFLLLVLKVPRQCPLVLLVEVCLTEGKDFGMLEGLHYSEMLI